MKTLKLTDEQFDTLKSMFEQEWQQEVMFQIDGDHDVTWLMNYLELYKAMLKAECDSGIMALVAHSLLEQKENEIKEIVKERRTNNERV